MPPAHISQTSSSRAISSVQGMRWRNSVTADDLQPDDDGLADDEQRRRPVKRALRGSVRRLEDEGLRPAWASTVPRSRLTRESAAARGRRRASAPRCSHSRCGRLPERGDVDLANGHAALAELGCRARVLRGADIALLASAASRAARSSSARTSAGSRCSAAGRRPQPEHAGDVPGARHVARDFEEALRQRRARVVLVAVDDAGLQRRVDLAERHRRRARSHQLHRLHVDRRLNGAQLQAGELRRAR